MLDSLKNLAPWTQFNDWVASVSDPRVVMAVLLGNLAATLFMCGVIVFVQVVHYPLFLKVGRNGFAGYAKSHQWLTSFVVGVPMIAEAVFAAVFLIWIPSITQIDGGLTLINVGLELFILGVTAVFSIPCHAALSEGYDAAVVNRLVLTNWLRTVAWLAKGWVSVALLWHLIAR